MAWFKFIIEMPGHKPIEETRWVDYKEEGEEVDIKEKLMSEVMIWARKNYCESLSTAYTKFKSVPLKLTKDEYGKILKDAIKRNKESKDWLEFVKTQNPGG